MMIKTVAVLGANGTMGKNVSAIFASFGNAKVYMFCRSKEQAEKAVDEAPVLVKADSIKERLIPVTYDDAGEVIPKCDLVFESVAENIDIKKCINQQIEKYLSPFAIFCTGTSGLSINQLSKGLSFDVQLRYMGVHFYNPPYNMPLCEIIPSKNTSENLKHNLKKYLREILFRTVVEVKDEAAFLGNRIGFFFINEAFQYAEKYKERGGVDYIDALLGPFTGRKMSPIMTADFVGLDVHKAIVDNVYYNSSGCSKESFKLPDYVKQLVEEGHLGRKSGCGMYKRLVVDGGKKATFVYDIRNNNFRENIKYDFQFKKRIIQFLEEGAYNKALNIIAMEEGEVNIIRSFIVRYVIYSLYEAKLLSTDIHAADHVMATGFNWLPPLAVIDAFGGKKSMLNMVKKADMNYIDFKENDIEKLLSEAVPSQYNFRRFLKAK